MPSCLTPSSIAIHPINPDTPKRSRGQPRKPGAPTASERAAASAARRRLGTVKLPGDVLARLDEQVRWPGETRVAALTRLIDDAAS